MKKVDRAMAEKLESVVRRHAEQTTLVTARAIEELHDAGFVNIDTIEDAQVRLDVQREHPGFAQWQIDILIRRAPRNRKARVAT